MATWGGPSLPWIAGFGMNTSILSGKVSKDRGALFEARAAEAVVRRITGHNGQDI